MTEKMKVLCVCSDNSARSQMAEAFLRKHGGDHFDVRSAGMAPDEIDPLTVQVMAEVDFDLSGHSSDSVGRYLDDTEPDYLVIMSAQVDRALPADWPEPGRRLLWPVEDPRETIGSDEKRLTKFREIRDRIDRGSVSLCLSMLARAREDSPSRPVLQRPKWTVATYR